MTDPEFLQKYDNGQKFSEEELSDMLWSFNIVDRIVGEDHRWQREMTTVFDISGRFFKLDWMKGLTENQESDFWKQPQEVRKHTCEKTIVVTEWVPVNE